MHNAVDISTGAKIIRPDILSPFAYDFDMRSGKGDRWHYVTSSNDLSDFDNHIKIISNHGCQYRIVAVKTGKIVKHN